jgi:peptidoglycan/xylan/chitin deacetylase (PgdA/CDA1 family)
VTARRRIAGGLGRLLYGTGLHRRLLRDRALIATFHRIDDRYPGNPITTAVPLFRELCAFVANHFQVVTLTALVQMLARREALGGYLALTFDDGYRDNHARAAPVLEEFRLPACFFVTAGFIGSRMVPWWDQEHGIQSEWMSWDNVRDLHARGFEIGAHTLTHPDLGKTAGTDAHREISGGKVAIEAALGAPVVHFAYPYGRPDQLSDANRVRVREAGYQSCVSSFGGAVRVGDDPLALKRTPVSSWHLSAGQFGFEVLRG